MTEQDASQLYLLHCYDSRQLLLEEATSRPGQAENRGCVSASHCKIQILKFTMCTCNYYLHLRPEPRQDLQEDKDRCNNHPYLSSL